MLCCGRMNAPLTSARLEGNTVRDLINALSLLDPDTVVKIHRVHTVFTPWASSAILRELVIETENGDRRTT